MKININAFTVKTWAIAALFVVTLVIIESKSMIGAFEAQKDLFAGIQWAAISFTFALIGLTGFAVAGILKDDIRPWVASRAKAARAVAAIAMLVPVCFLGASIKSDTQAQRWDSYIAQGPNGEQSLYAIDSATAADMMGDTYIRQEARNRMASMRPGATDLTPADIEFWIAVFFQGVLLWGADALRLAAPMTADEREHLKRSQAARKGAATRRRNKANKVVKEKIERRAVRTGSKPQLTLFES